MSTVRKLICGSYIYFCFWAGWVYGEAVQRKFHFPIYGGFSFTSHRATTSNPVTSVNGIAFGIGGYYQLLPKLRVGLDILHVGKSYEEGGTSPTKYNLAYLQVPIKIYWLPLPEVALHTGPYVASFIMSATRETQGNLDSVKASFSNDFGIETGIWIGFRPNQRMTIGLDTRFDLGLSDIESDNDPKDVVRTRTVITLFTVQFAF